VDVLDLIAARAEAAPLHPAAKDLERDLSYTELIADIRRIAAGLERLGVKRHARVALHLPNSVDFLVAALACNWIGAIFVPLAATDPPARLKTIIDDCDPSLVIVDDEAAQVAEHLSGRLTATMSSLRAEGGNPPTHSTLAGDDAYIIYTSGTTGSPKGVLVGAAAFCQAVRETARALELGQQTRALCVSPFHFDGSFGTLFSTPIVGGSLVIRRRESLLLPRMFLDAVEREQINHTSFSPSYLRRLLSSPQLSRLAATNLRTLGLGGEECVAGDLRRLWEAVPGLRVFNLYGPTETVIQVTIFEVKPSHVSSESSRVPIGYPNAGVIFRLIGSDGEVIEGSGRTGELYVGGPQLMSRYWNDDELTNRVIRDDVVAGERLYRTGDLVCRDESGAYVYVDRTDRVVKRSGVRISLAEMASALRRIDGVVEADCAPFVRDGQLQIAAFVVSTGSRDVVELRHSAQDHLPVTMLPDVIEIVDSLPVTPAGKLDERALLSGAGLTATGTSPVGT
jgi:amino acid adenylation domain-containing protein